MALDETSADRLIAHFADVAAGTCRITDDLVEAEADPKHRELLLGLMLLHEELELRRRRQAEAEQALREANDELERQVTLRTVALQKTQEQLLHSQKMEAVGRLAGGIAHDFNNLLSVVMSYTSLILEDLPAKDPLRDDIHEIALAGKRCAELTHQLLAFSRRQVLQTRTVDVNQILGGLAPMLQRTLGADVALSILKGDVGCVRADPGQLEQVVLNLAVNARDVMPSGGMLTIETREVALEAGDAEVEPGTYVCLTVTDTGTGMTKEVQAHVFEPFFTTKPPGKGTGLGLSTVFGIVRQSGGHVSVQSELGRGTTFSLFLPVTEGVPASRTSSAPAGRATDRGTETILLVEDQDQVRGVARDILRRKGYRVLDAPNGGEALLLCEQHEAPIHLLLTDVVLPHMSGRQLAERVRCMRPTTKVLFMSGYTGDTVLQHGVLDSSLSFLQKPLTSTSLARKVREVLDR